MSQSYSADDFNALGGCNGAPGRGREGACQILIHDDQPNVLMSDSGYSLALWYDRWKSKGSGDLPSELGDIDAAVRLHCGPKHSRLFLEARIIANQPIEDIAVSIDVPAAVISAYENVFFDVRSRLRARDWIRAFVIQPPFLLYAA